MKNNPLFTLFLLLLPVFSCKTATKPVADCDPGYLPCEDDITQCCEVICPDLYHNCGGQLTDCCLDSTSHSFSWSIDTLGIYGSYLNDVAIVNENDIWVVGNIETDNGEYNAARWNGTDWELMGIYSNTLDLYSIQYFNEDDIWVTDHCSPIYWDGNEWTLYHLQNMGLDACAGNAIWGTSSSDMYFVGVNGGIVHYDGANFVQMESGTDVDLKDIAGTPDGEHVFVTGWDATYPAPCIVLELINGIWNTVYYTEGSQPVNNNIGWIWSVDVYLDTAFFPSTAGLWKYNYTNQDSILLPNSISHMNESAFKSINIKAVNDIFFAGSGFHYLHYNGNTYQHSHEITDMFAQRALNGADYNGNIAVMVGYCCWWGHAIIARGYHLQ